MNPIVFALRRPYTVMVAVVALIVGASLAASRTRVDIFPNLNQPVIYVCQPYGGMTPQQMEGLLNYEYHFLYVNGIEHVESKNIQGMTLLKLYFHPGTNMAEAMAETVASVNRSRFMMPPGTVPPFVSRLDIGSASVGFLVLNSDSLAIKDIQDIATLRVRPMFASVPGISTPPAFGGNQRAIVVTVEPDKLQAQGLTLDQITDALAQGNPVAPSGNARLDDRNWIVTSNAMVGGDPTREVGAIPIKLGPAPVFIRDVAKVADAADITAGYVLVNGRRSVYMLVTKRSDASTISVVNELKRALPKMREAVPELDIQFAFDQSPIVEEAMLGVAIEGAIGALLTGVMVLLFLRDWRSVIVVVLNIPLALMAALFALWVCGQTINLMTLGGLALAVGILVDEATVEVENIHTQLVRVSEVARAVRLGNQETAVPRLLAMLCVLAVFVPSFFMAGASRELFAPLSMAVGFAMIASYILSSTFVPVMCVWLLKSRPRSLHGLPNSPSSGAMRKFERMVARLVRSRRFTVPVFFIVVGAIAVVLVPMLGTAVFPPTDKGQFQLRLRAPTGTRIERTEELAQLAVRVIEREAGAGNVKMTVGYVGQMPTNYPVQGIYQWTTGPEEVLLRVALQPSAGVSINAFQNRLREVLAEELREHLKKQWQVDGVPADTWAARAAGLKLSFEPGDLVNEVMSFGSPNPVEVQISGPRPADNLAHARKLYERMAAIPTLRDVQIRQPQDYPTLDISIDRERAATMGLTARNISNALIPATASSRYMMPIYWRDPKAGQAYIIQVQLPPQDVNSIAAIGRLPVHGMSGMAMGMNGHATGNGLHTTTSLSGAAVSSVLLRDVATLRETVGPGEIDRYNMRRYVSITANIGTADLGAVDRAVRQAIHDTGPPPKSTNVDIRGQLHTLRRVQSDLTIGLAIAVLAVLLLLTANFQSIRLSLIVLSTVPATLCGVALLLFLTGSTLNMQSFTGAIMSLGVSVANAILLVTFAERARRVHGNAARAGLDAACSRLRPVLMTTCAMIAGMLPMAIGFGAGGDQVAPLARAVIGGLAASTFATLFILPAVFALLQAKASVDGASLDPDDPQSSRHDLDHVALFLNTRDGSATF